MLHHLIGKRKEKISVHHHREVEKTLHWQEGGTNQEVDHLIGLLNAEGVNHPEDVHAHLAKEREFLLTYHLLRDHHLKNQDLLTEGKERQVPHHQESLLIAHLQPQIV